MPAGSTPAEVMKAVNMLIIRNAKESLSNDETITAGNNAINIDNDANMTTNEVPSSIVNDIIVGNDVIMSPNETPKPMRDMHCCQYARAVMWTEDGYGKYLTAKIVMVGSFAVCTSVQTAVLTTAHKNGVGSRPNYSMFVKMMVQEILGEVTIYIDFYPETHPANALDKRVPSDLACQGAACASDIVKLGLTVIAFGGHAQAALCKAVKQTNRNVKTIHAPHPCTISAYKSTNDVAIDFAKRYDELFPSNVGSFEGFVFGYGLNPDTQDFGVGGVLSVNFCKRHLEKVSGKPCETVHMSASSFCLGLGVKNDEQAAAYLTSIGRGHHLVPSRTLLYIILHAIKGGSCGGLNDYRVLEAQMMLDILCNASKIDDDAIEAAMKVLEHVIELRNITSKGKSEGGIKGGSCGDDNDYRVVTALAKVEELIDASKIDNNAIKAAMKALEYAIELRDITSKGKSKGGIKSGSCGGDNNYQVNNAIEMVEILLDASKIDDEAIEDAMETLKEAIEMQQKSSKGKRKGAAKGGSVTSEDSFNVLNWRISQMEAQGTDFDVTLQELKDWRFIDQPKKNGNRDGEKKLLNFKENRCKIYKHYSRHLTSL